MHELPCQQLVSGSINAGKLVSQHSSTLGGNLETAQDVFQIK
jgi:hypothetical protein